MSSSQSENESKAEWTVGLLSWGCLMLVLYSTIPLLTILSGILLITRELIFWGVAIIMLGVLALIGPFYALLMPKTVKDESSGKANEE